MINSGSLVSACRALRLGEVTPGDYTDTLRERIEQDESEIRALVEEKDRWQRLERELTEIKQAAGKTYGERPPLFGVPIGVKDIIHVRSLETRAGSDVPPEELTGDEADAIIALREAGAVILGKTVTTEFAYFDPGPTRNPNDLQRTPGGSSSGSAAAVASGMCPLALGSQTGGSVIRPAAFCGTVGVKPSYGRIPTGGVIPMAPSADHVGYFTIDVPSARLAASVLYDEWAPASEPEKPTLGVPADAYVKKASELGQQRFEAHCTALENAGFEVRRMPDLLANIEVINDRHLSLIEAEVALVHHDWYEAYPNRYSESFTELIDNGREYEIEALGTARAGQIELRKTIESMLDEHCVDVIISPAAPGPAPEGIDDTGDPVMNLPWTHAGVPVTAVPAERTEEGLPLALQCATRFGDDERLLAWTEMLAEALPLND